MNELQVVVLYNILDTIQQNSNKKIIEIYRQMHSQIARLCLKFYVCKGVASQTKKG